MVARASLVWPGRLVSHGSESADGVQAVVNSAGEGVELETDSIILFRERAVSSRVQEKRRSSL